MSFLVGSEAPAFTASAVMPDNEMVEVSLSDYRHKKYVVLFFYPLDFTFVCPTELISVNNSIVAFESMDTKVFGVSVDSAYSHMAWRNTPVEKGGIGNIQFPLIADLNKDIARSYNVLLGSGVALRGTFLIDKAGIVRHACVNDLPLGRSTDELLRIVSALQHHEKHGEVCPAGWRTGKDALQPTAESVADFLVSHSDKL